jgi:lipopolysaccharide transport system permease protein
MKISNHHRDPQRRPWRATLISYRDIIREFAVADFRLRYHDSVLGYVWFLLSPALMFCIYYYIFTRVIVTGIPDYAIYLLLGIISYNFFSDCTFSAMYSINGKAPIIKKVYFPRYLIVLSSTLTALFSLSANFCIVLAVCLFTHGFSPLTLLVPIPFICLILFSAGVSFILAILYVQFRDLGQIWNVLVLALFWVTPVVYNINSLPESTQIIVFLNPLARIFMLFRHYLLYNFFDLQFLLITIGSSVAMFIAGFYIFKKYQDQIAEYL